MKTTRNLKKARELVENFKKTYQREIGLPIIVFACYNEEMTMEILSLNDLKEIADELVQIKKSILEKTRKKEVMVYKHIFCKVAKEMGNERHKNKGCWPGYQCLDAFLAMPVKEVSIEHWLDRGKVEIPTEKEKMAKY